MITAISVVKRRVRRSTSPIESCFGSTVTPPLPPPYGRSITAHFHDIHMASAFTSSMFTSWWNRMPPLAGPRPRLCWTRWPSKTRVEPSSMRTGKCTVSCRRGSRSTAAIPGSRFSRLAARSNCCWATAHALFWLILDHLMLYRPLRREVAVSRPRGVTRSGYNEPRKPVAVFLSLRYPVRSLRGADQRNAKALRTRVWSDRRASANDPRLERPNRREARDEIRSELLNIWRL